MFSITTAHVKKGIESKGADVLQHKPLLLSFSKKKKINFQMVQQFDVGSYQCAGQTSELEQTCQWAGLYEPYRVCVLQSSFMLGQRAEEACKLQLKAHWLVRFVQWLEQKSCYWLFGYTQHCSSQGVESLMHLVTQETRVRSFTCCMRHSAVVVKISLCSQCFPSLPHSWLLYFPP